MLAELQYRFLTRRWPLEPPNTQPHGATKLAGFIKPLDPLLGGLAGLDVLDFGCGDGDEAISLAQTAKSVVGLDINPKWIHIARGKSEGMRNVRFTTHLEADEKFDAVISLDAFEHFEDPTAMLKLMHDALKPGGVLVASFGPTWYHPYGGHLFSAFPWAHLLCKEQALLKWRNNFRESKATRLKEGMNGWTIAKFERMVKASPFQVEMFRCVPINALRKIHCRLTREFSTTIVQMKLRKHRVSE